MQWNRQLADKLGLGLEVFLANPLCYQQLVHVLSAMEMDFNLFFDALTRIAQRGGGAGAPESESALLACSYQPQPDAGVLRDWLRLYQSLAEEKPLMQRVDVMRAANPVFILRNHLVQDVIDAAETGDCLPLQEIFSRLKSP